MKSESLFLCLTGHMAMLKRKTWNKCANLQLIKKILTEKNRKMLTKCGRIQMKKSKFNWMIELWIVVLFNGFYKNTTVQSVSLNFSDLLSCLCGFGPAAIISLTVLIYWASVEEHTIKTRFECKVKWCSLSSAFNKTIIFHSPSACLVNKIQIQWILA